LRDILSTEGRVAFRQNKIEFGHEEAITLHQCHSSTTARIHYQKDRKADAALGAIAAHAIMYGKMPSNFDDIDSADDNDPYSEEGDHSTSTNDEGNPATTTTTTHLVRTRRTRTTWTDSEESWVRKWVYEYIQGGGNAQRIQWKQCVYMIQHSEEALDIFQYDHVEISKLQGCAKRQAMSQGCCIRDLRP
jgi:hypothetical protein